MKNELRTRTNRNMIKGICRRLFGAMSFLAVICPISGFGATTIAVPAQKATIQAAIDSAANGDTIVVGPGVYKEDLVFKGKAIKVVSSNGAAVTTIAGLGDGYGIEFANNEGPTTVVSGFTIQNAAQSYATSVYSINASPTLSDNVFLGDSGTAIEGWNSSMTLQRNLFTGWGSCGGFGNSVVSFVNSSSPSIKDNVFADNRCAGLYIILPVGNAPDVANNTFVGNDIGLSLDGRVEIDSQRYRNNLLFGNRVGISMYLAYPNGIYSSVQNNLVYGNTTNYDGIFDQTGSNGNFSADPKLGGLGVPDFHPGEGSAAIGAGLTAAVGSGETDFYGQSRVRVGSGGASTVDVGAVQYLGTEPQVSLISSATSGILGSSVTLNWSSSGANQCAASGAWNGALALSGSRTIIPPAGVSTFALVCSNYASARGRKAIVTIYPPPTVTLTASPASIVENASSTLQWSSTTATSCVKGGAWMGTANTQGSLVVVPKAGTYTYTLTCTGPDGSAASTTTLTVLARPQISLTFSPTTTPVGGTSTITWTTANTTMCTASGSWSGSQPLNGSLVVGPFTVPGLYSYELACSGPGGSTSSIQGVSVFIPPANSASQPVSLSAVENLYATGVEGKAVPGGGIDGLGNAYAYDQLGAVVWQGQGFTFDPPGAVSAAANKVIPLPGGKDTSLTLLATGVRGNQPGQTFIVTYTDGTKTSFTQSLSDWKTPQNYPGEKTLLSPAYRITSTGGTQMGPYNVYAYQFKLDSSKIVQSLTLPNNPHVVLLALSVTSAAGAYPVDLSSLATIDGIVNSNQPTLAGGLDGLGNAYAAGLVGGYVTKSGVTFSLGTAGQPSVATNTVIPLPFGQTSVLNLLAVGVRGNQPNQVFIVTYTDGSKTTIKQSISDWHTPQQYAGESIALSTAYRVTANGSTQNGPYNIYAYRFAVDSSKFIQTLTLPNNSKVMVLALDQTGL